jgi:hypothetical protein
LPSVRPHDGHWVVSIDRSFFLYEEGIGLGWTNLDAVRALVDA